MLVTNIFIFSRNVFKSLLLQDREKSELCMKEINIITLIHSEDAEDPASIPIYWVSKWVDYSDKYGLGYQLCDNSVGVLFNDSTRLILLANGE